MSENFDIALKHLSNDTWEAKNKEYDWPFQVKYDAMILAEELLSNPRIISKEKYDNY